VTIDDHVSPYKIPCRRGITSIDTTEDFANQGETEWVNIIDFQTRVRMLFRMHRRPRRKQLVLICFGVR
jgi:hypothetical protein